MIFGMLLAQESPAAQFHALAARRAGATWGELHKAAELASVVQSLGPLNNGAAPAGKDARRGRRGKGDTAMNDSLYEALTPDNCALLLIDHQAGLFLGVQSMDQQALKSNVLALAKTAQALKLPTVLTTSSAHGPNGPTLPELRALFPDVPPIDRSPINLWNDDASRGAVEATGRKKLIMAAITTDVCLLFPALSAINAGTTCTTSLTPPAPGVAPPSSRPSCV